MTIEQLSKLLYYIQEHNSWQNSSFLFEGRRQPKYIDIKLWFTLDTRDGIVFYLKTRHAGQDKSWRIEDEKDLHKLYEYLDEVVYQPTMYKGETEQLRFEFEGI